MPVAKTRFHKPVRLDWTMLLLAVPVAVLGGCSGDVGDSSGGGGPADEGSQRSTAREPASLSPAAIELLREEVGFEGVVITDDLNMQGASGGPAGVPGAAVAAVRAGADLMIVSGTPQEQADAYQAVVAAVESGKVPQNRINASVERILEVKRGYPLYGGWLL